MKYTNTYRQFAESIPGRTQSVATATALLSGNRVEVQSPAGSTYIVQGTGVTVNVNDTVLIQDGKVVSTVSGTLQPQLDV